MVESLFLLICAVKVLPSCQQSLNQKGCFYQITAVIEHAKNRHSLSRASVHVVGPCAVIAICIFEETDDLAEALYALLASDELPVHADDQGGDAKATRARGNDSIVSRTVFTSHAGMGVGAVPVIAKARLLQHV